MIFCIASIGAAVQSNPPGTLIKPHGTLCKGSMSSMIILRSPRSSWAGVAVVLGELSLGDVLDRSWSTTIGCLAPNGGFSVIVGGVGERLKRPVKSELSNEQETSRTVHRWHL